MKILKWSAGALLAIAVAVPVAVYLASEARIAQRYTLPSSVMHAEITPYAIARGRHLATIFGCRDCHGADMSGRMLSEDHGFFIEATNLRAFARIATDEDFDVAVRHGLSPAARALWVMPADSYVYMRNDDLADIIAYIRSLPPDSSEVREPDFGFPARLAILECKLTPADPYSLGQDTPIGVGPHWDGGRYLAAVGCSECHASDLTGEGKAPDLKIAADYSRAQFFHLLHGGAEKNGKISAMSVVGGTRFSAFHDYESDALYDYLVERARMLKTSSPPPPAPAIRNTPCPPAHRPLQN